MAARSWIFFRCQTAPLKYSYMLGGMFSSCACAMCLRTVSEYWKRSPQMRQCHWSRAKMYGRHSGLFGSSLGLGIFKSCKKNRNRSCAHGASQRTNAPCQNRTHAPLWQVNRARARSSRCACRSARTTAHRPRRIGLHRSDPRDGRQRAGAQLQKLPAGKSYGVHRWFRWTGYHAVARTTRAEPSHARVEIMSLSDELLSLSSVEMRRRIGTKEISPVELVEA